MHLTRTAARRLALPVGACLLAAPALLAGTPGTAAASGSEKVITAYTTGYTWFDNTPVGSAQIAYPTIHRVAGGTGTWGDPITIATAKGAYTPGTRFYIPSVRRYFVAEDFGGANMYRPPVGSAWLDLWIGGQGGSSRGADACASAITGGHKVVVNPSPGYEVRPGTIYDGTCHAGYGEALVRAGSTARAAAPAPKPAAKKAVAVKKATPVKKATVAKKVTPAKKVTHATKATAAYTVRPGDTLSRIAQQHHTTWQALFQLNRGVLKSPNLLLVGQQLRLA